MLNLSASDVTGISSMRFSSDGIIWGLEQAFGKIWTWNLEMGDGQKKVYVQFKDNAGNWSQSCTDTLILDTVAPVLILPTLPDGSYTNQATLNVSGMITDTTSGLDTVTVNGTAVLVQDGAFSHTLTLNSGANVITTIATDNAGNTATDTRTITLDQQAPMIVITAPSDNGKTNQSSVTVQGTVDEKVTATSKVNSGFVQTLTLMNNSFSSQVALTSDFLIPCSNRMAHSAGYWTSVRPLRHGQLCFIRSLQRCCHNWLLNVACDRHFLFQYRQPRFLFYKTLHQIINNMPTHFPQIARFSRKGSGNLILPGRGRSPIWRFSSSSPMASLSPFR
jgi:hypothetical protein